MCADHTLFVGDQRATVDAVIRFLDRQVAGGALRRADRKNAAGTGWNSLTPSEREVARLIASRMTNNRVAARLGMSLHTVDGRLRRVFAKLGLNTRVQLTAEVRARDRLTRDHAAATAAKSYVITSAGGPRRASTPVNVSGRAPIRAGRRADQEIIR